MGFYLTEQSTDQAAGNRSFSRRFHVEAKTFIGTPFGNPILSTKYWDEDTKLLSYQLRDYCPGTGRWASRDPIGEISPNIYMFCGNSLNQIDVYGLMSERELGILLAWWYFYGNGELFTYGSDVLKKQVNVYQPTQIWLREFGDRVCKRLLQNKKYGEETGIISSLLNGIKADNSDWLLHTINGAEEFRVNGTYTAIACSHCYIEFDLKYAFVDKADMHWNRWPDRWLIIWRFLPHPLPRGEEYSIRIEWNEKSSFVTPGSPSYSGWPFVINE